MKSADSKDADSSNGTPSPADNAERVLVLAPSGRDAKLTAALLGTANIDSTLCHSIEDLCREMQAGAAMALIAEEALTASNVQRLKNLLEQQQPWSDFPIVVFSAPGRSAPRDAEDALRVLGNITFLDRPVQVRTMLAAVDASIRARRHQYDARSAIESRDQFLAMLGHELRNPLGAIRLAVDLMRHAKDARLRRETCEVLDRQSKHVTRLVDDLLDVARVTYGKVTLHRTLLDVNDVVRDSFHSHELSARTRHLQFTLRESSRLPVLGDSVRLGQVFGNLLTNAIKYTPSGGNVLVEVGNDGPSALVRVVDSGVGIVPDMLEKVFDLFTQADRSLERAQGGMGVGLTVARTLVRLHGGDIRVMSEGIGRGSEFCVSLPLHGESSECEQPSATDASPPVARRRVVVVEDSDDNRAMLRALLVMKGHDVTTAASGPEGLERIHHDAPDVALVDIGLPGFDGFELARRVRAAGGAPVFLVALTGYGQPEDRRRAREAGFDAHLTKPVGVDQIETILQALDSDTSRAPVR